MHGRITTLSLVLGLFMSGCQDSRYVTREQFDAWAAAHHCAEQTTTTAPHHQEAVNRLYSSLKGIKLAIRVTSDNLANADTYGYKALSIRFADDGAEARSVSDFALGPPIPTHGDFDLMIVGEGFFKVSLPHPDSGFAYTRAGNFFRNRDGDLVLCGSNGPRLEPAVNVPEGVTGIEVSADGTISAISPGAVAPTQLGQIELAYFTSPQGLITTSDSLFIETHASGFPITGTPDDGAFGSILHKYLESSNVDPDIEMAKLTNLNWRYEEVRQAIQMLSGPRASK